MRDDKDMEEVDATDYEPIGHRYVEPWPERQVFAVGGLKVTRGMVAMLVAISAIAGMIWMVAVNTPRSTAYDASTESRSQADGRAKADDSDAGGSSFDASDLVGMDAYEAHDAAVDAGLRVRFVSAGDAAKTDITGDVYSGSKRLAGWDDWQVVSVSDSGDVITCTIDSQADIDAKAQGEEDRKAGESVAPAVMTACQREGGERYPGGYDEHDVLGVIQDVVRRGDGNFLYKVKATVDPDTDVVVECVTTGDSDSQTVVSWEAH